MDFRIGFGFDVHQLAEGYDLMLGGVKIDHNKGVVGHSDADVLIHAICDALLGAAGLRDIGYHFPDNDPAYLGIDSRKLLKKVIELLDQRGYATGNVDATISLQQPKIAPFIPEMKKKLAAAMQVEEDRISIKATTTEKLGFEGREEGVSAHAVALIKSDAA